MAGYLSPGPGRAYLMLMFLTPKMTQKPVLY